MHDDIAARYQQRIDYAQQQRSRLSRRELRLSLARGCVFVGGALLALAAWNVGLFGWVAALTLLLFLALAIWHETVADQLREVDRLRQMHQQQLARGRRQWNDLPVVEVDVPQDRQHVARDLDLFGRRSIFQWLCVAHTPMGRRTLRDWLLYPADPATIQQRQRIVRALAEHFDWRETLQLHGSLLGPRPADNQQFVDWAEGSGWLSSRRWLHLAALIIPAALLIVVLAVAIDVLPPFAAVVAIGVVIVLNAALSVMYAGTIHQVFDLVSGRSDQVRHYRDMLHVVAQMPAEVGSLPLENDDLRHVAQRGIERLSALQRIVRLANARRDSFYGILHIAAQLFVLWDVHLLAWLEHWQRRFGRESSLWFAAIGQIEALCSLATAAHDNPTWAYPTIDAAATTLQIAQLGHPLLTDASRVANDVSLGPPGTFLLITGSNMSGKTTLLRSLGVNVVLAQAGGVVCAQQLVMPPLDVETSMRVADSLADGVSLFLAELRRMKDIVDRARSSQNNQRRLLYLLDEILQGTNSRERQVAVVRVIGHLLQHGAIGAVSTHDLELAACPEIQQACQVVHFRETLTWENGQRKMSFDYELRSGVSPTTNALVLLDMVGLSEEVE